MVDVDIGGAEPGAAGKWQVTVPARSERTVTLRAVPEHPEICIGVYRFWLREEEEAGWLSLPW